VVELPAFDHAVLYHQATASSAGGVVAVGPPAVSPQLPGINPRQSSLIVLNDPEVSPSLLLRGFCLSTPYSSMALCMALQRWRVALIVQG